MSLRKLLQQNLGLIVTSIGTIISAESVRIALGERKARLEAASSENTKLMSELSSKQDLIIESLEKQNKIGGLSSNASDHINGALQEMKIINHLAMQIKDQSISEEERSLVVKQILSHSENQVNKIEIANKSLSEIKHIAFEKSSESAINPLNDIIESYREYLSTLNLEELVAITNLFGLILLSSCVVTIGVIYFSQFFINYFNLHDKYPRLYSYIDFRRKFQFYFLIINGIMVCIGLIFLILFNIYVLTYSLS